MLEAHLRIKKVYRMWPYAYLDEYHYPVCPAQIEKANARIDLVNRGRDIKVSIPKETLDLAKLLLVDWDWDKHLDVLKDRLLQLRFNYVGNVINSDKTKWSGDIHLSKGIPNDVEIWDPLRHGRWRV